MLAPSEVEPIALLIFDLRVLLREADLRVTLQRASRCASTESKCTNFGITPTAKTKGLGYVTAHVNLAQASLPCCVDRSEWRRLFGNSAEGRVFVAVVGAVLCIEKGDTRDHLLEARETSEFQLRLAGKRTKQVDKNFLQSSPQIDRS